MILVLQKYKKKLYQVPCYLPMYSPKKQINNHIYLNHYTLKIHTLYISSIASNIGKLQLKGSKAYDGVFHIDDLSLCWHTQFRNYFQLQEIRFCAARKSIFCCKKRIFSQRRKTFCAARKEIPRSKKQNSAQQGKRFCAARIFLSCYMDFLAYKLWDFPAYELWDFLIHMLRDLLE